MFGTLFRAPKTLSSPPAPGKAKAKVGQAKAQAKKPREEPQKEQNNGSKGCKGSKVKSAPKEPEQPVSSQKARRQEQKRRKRESKGLLAAPKFSETWEPQAWPKPGKHVALQQEVQGQREAAPRLLSSTSPFASSRALSRAAEKLQGSRFRWLNETLYSISGGEAKTLFEKDPTLAQAYHEGFRAQAKKWPRNPLDDVIKWLKGVPATAVIGDFGCGEARLALELKGRKVHSFDLVEVNERVTPCNLAAVPLPDGVLDIAVFCLALMGTDWPAFLAEAHRCLRSQGILHIVEVESRFADVGALVRRVEAIGFHQVHVKLGNFFAEMRFAKSGVQKRKRGHSEGADLLSGCIYRRR